MIFEIVSTIENVETIAKGSSVRVGQMLRKKYGKGNWKKKKGTATVKLRDDLTGLPKFIGTKHTESERGT